MVLEIFLTECSVPESCRRCLLESRDETIATTVTAVPEGKPDTDDGAEGEKCGGSHGV